MRRSHWTRTETAEEFADPMAFAFGYWRRSGAILMLQIVLLLGAAAFDLSAPWAAGRLLDVVSRPVRQEAPALLAVAVLVALFAGQHLLRTAAQWVGNRVIALNMQRIGQDILARVIRFSAAWHADMPSGGTVRTLSQAMTAHNNLTNAVLVILGPSVLVLGGMVVTIGLKWPLAGALVAAVALGMTGLNLFLTARWTRPANLHANACDTALNAALSDIVGTHASVRNFAAEEREEVRFDEAASVWRVASVFAWDRFTALSMLQNGLLVGLQAGLLGLLVWAWIERRASPGDVAFGVTSFLLIAGYLRSLPETLRLVRRSLDELEPAARLARTQPQVRDRVGAHALPRRRSEQGAEISFEGVGFRHAGAARPLLRDFELVIERGEHVALVGPTGAGKSTLVGLLTRLYDLEEGRILIDGCDIAQVTQASVRRAVAVVPQEPVLFHRSIAENIAYGHPGATPDEVVRAARKACAHDFISQLPSGYDTLVGERGGKLSGGERQRVAIARAFLAEAPIVVFDEATSALDVETEGEVTRAAAALMNGRTTIVVAHRLSTVRNADRIIVLEHGRIVQTGSHDILMAKPGLYARLVSTAALAKAPAC